MKRNYRPLAIPHGTPSANGRGSRFPLAINVDFQILDSRTVNRQEVPSQLYGTSHTIDWWRAAAVWGSALPGEGGGGKRGCSKGPGHCPHPNGAWAAGGVAKEAPGLGKRVESETIASPR
eukprot:COSAG02_NODE_11170_length_1777_cov_36.646603_3_plen_119_part_01